MSFGGGGGGSQQTSEFKPPSFAGELWPDWLNTVAATTLTPYEKQQYYGMEVAPINNTQVQGMQYTADIAGNNAPDYGAARAMNQITAAGGFENPYSRIQTENDENPYLYGALTDAPWAKTEMGSNPMYGKVASVGGNPFVGKEASVGGNPYLKEITKAAANPYLDANVYAGINPYLHQKTTYGDARNKYVGQQTQLDKNKYMGESGAYNAMKKRAMNDVAQAYATGTAAQTDSAFNRPGAFRGGQHEAQISANQYGLGQALGNLAEKMDTSQWQYSGGLNQQEIQNQLAAQQGDFARNAQYAEAGLNRGLNAQQVDLARNSQLGQERVNLDAQLGLQNVQRNLQGYDTQAALASQNRQQDLARQTQYWDAMANRSMSGQQADLARNAQYWDAMANRSMTGQLADLSRNSQLKEGELSRGLSARQADLARNVGMAESALDRSFAAQTNDLNRGAQYWDAERNRQMQSLPFAMQAEQHDLTKGQRITGIGDALRQYQQDMLNQSKNNYNQFQQFPYSILDIMGNALSRASGGYGTQLSQTTQNYQANPYASLIGGGLAGLGMYGNWPGG